MTTQTTMEAASSQATDSSLDSSVGRAVSPVVRDRLAELVRAHGMTVRRTSAAGVWAASAAMTSEGFACSELSPVLATRQSVRDWLGY